jgi:D-inositol-3-phosphate glycosyltransferase
LPTAVADGVSGVLVDGHEPREWAHVLYDLLLDSDRRSAYASGALTHAAQFGWDATADATIAVYEHALRDRETAKINAPARQS